MKLISAHLIAIFIFAGTWAEKVFVEIDTSNVINTVSDLFLGVALDTSLFTEEGLRKDIDIK